MVRGALGFAAVSLAAFSVWAFGGRWFTSEPVMYGAITLVFAGLSGLLLHPLVIGPRSLVRFYMAFVPAFVAYAVVWSACWFTLQWELLASLAGTATFALVAGGVLGGLRSFPKAAAVLFVAHSIGYYLGGMIYYEIRGEVPVVARLSWGLLYGLGFGAGLGYAFRVFQTNEKS